MNDEMAIAMRIAILAIQLGIILFAARIFGNLARKIHVPSVLGELVAGIVIGPYVLGAFGLPLHGFEHGLFPLPAAGGPPVSPLLYALATLGSIVLLFMSGLETDLRMFFRYSLVGTIVGLGGVIFSFIFGGALGMLMFKTGFMDPRCLFLGILCTATSVGITARILSEKKSIDSPEGTTILAAAVIDDVLGIICLAIVMGIVGAASLGGTVAWGGIGLIAVKSVGIWLGITALGLFFAHRIAGWLKLFQPSATFSVLALGLALLLAGFFEEAGLAMIVGAYVTGLCLSKTDISFSIQRQLTGIYNFLVPVFFVVMGMLVDVRVFGDAFVLKYGIIYAALAILAKVIGCALPAWFMNFNTLGALRIGAGMIPRGEVALIIAGIGSTTMVAVNGVKAPIIDSSLFGIAIIMTLLTTVAAPPLLAAVLGIRGRGVRHEVKELETVHTLYHIHSEVIREFVLRIMQANFRHEGFRHSELDREGGITHFRRAGTTFTFHHTGETFDFESTVDEAPLIKTVMYETFVEIRRAMTELKDFAAPRGLESTLDGFGNSGVSKKRKTTVPVEKIIPPDCVVTQLHAADPQEAIRELVGRLNAAGMLCDAQKCEADALAREAVMSTCIPGGIALPHARTDGVNRLVAAVGVSHNGCPSTGEQHGLTHIFVLSLCPKSAQQPYLEFVAHVAGALSKPEKVKAVLDSQDPAAIRHLFIEG
ncbi:MAG: cation:proton antiporter [Victivallaceae bacterium]|nr:cation:proton antiporter [Victivallaceae bacterium]